MKHIKISDIIKCIEEFAPLHLQESYDNAGLVVGDKEKEISKALVCIDITDDIIDEAINNSCELIISHHPLIFKGLKKLTGNGMVERIVIKAIKNDIAIYSAHTNLDNTFLGVNHIFAEKLGLKELKILAPKSNLLKKLVTFVPNDHLQNVRTSLFDAGAGHIGNYDNCSFNTKGTGSFRASENTNPFVGNKNELHFEGETRLETIFPAWQENKIINSLIASHPYEEVAYDIYPLDNTHHQVGSGMIGILESETDTLEFLNKVKEITKTDCIRHTNIIKDKVKKVAICGGSGSFLLSSAIRNNADVFITGDMKYHEFFNADGKIIIADIGHYESEQFTMELISSIIKEKFSTFAIRLTEVNTNSIKYL
ncbi:MAG: Nif3-like dinuclear metal center hexameric protein [Hyphomicrobiales bacterium]